MQITQTKHFNERVEERYYKPTDYAKYTFEWLIKKFMKGDNMRGRLVSHDGAEKEFDGEMVQTKWLIYHDRREKMKFCYCGKFPKFTLITFFQEPRYHSPTD